MTKALLDLRGVSKRFGAVYALAGVGFHAEAGSGATQSGPPGGHKRSRDPSRRGCHLRDQGRARRDHSRLKTELAGHRQRRRDDPDLLDAAAVIGGTTLFSGRGQIRTAVLGAIVIAMIDNDLGLLNVTAGTKFAVTGLVLLAAVTRESLTRRGRSATGSA